MQIRDKVFLITGGASGLGAAAAQALVQDLHHYTGDLTTALSYNAVVQHLLRTTHHSALHPVHHLEGQWRGWRQSLCGAYVPGWVVVWRHRNSAARL